MKVKKNKFFEDLKQGLEEVVAHLEGKITLKSEIIEVPENTMKKPVIKYQPVHVCFAESISMFVPMQVSLLGEDFDYIRKIMCDLNKKNCIDRRECHCIEDYIDPDHKIKHIAGYWGARHHSEMGYWVWYASAHFNLVVYSKLQEALKKWCKINHKKGPKWEHMLPNPPNEPTCKDSGWSSSKCKPIKNKVN